MREGTGREGRSQVGDGSKEKGREREREELSREEAGWVGWIGWVALGEQETRRGWVVWFRVGKDGVGFGVGGWELQEGSGGEADGLKWAEENRTTRGFVGRCPTLTLGGAACMVNVHRGRGIHSRRTSPSASPEDDNMESGQRWSRLLGATDGSLRMPLD